MDVIREVIVVEGKSDTAAVRRAVEADTIETGGSAINEAVYRKIELARERRGVIILTDPDYPGERLRRLIGARIPGCKQAFLTREEALSRNGGDLGIENASPEAIRRALAGAKTDYEQTLSAISWEDLIEAGLIVHPEASSRRGVVGQWLGIGYANGKQFYKRCLMFQISKEEFTRAVERLENGEDNG